MTEIRCPFGETRACATEAVEERCRLRELNGRLASRVERLEAALRDLCSVAEECVQDADRHDIEDNIKDQLDGIYVAVGTARDALEESTDVE